MIYWDSEKNLQLIEKREISFEEIKAKILKGEYIDILDHPIRSNQKYFIMEIRNYIWVVPFVFEETKIFLKTAWPSRKMTKKYKNKGAIKK